MPRVVCRGDLNATDGPTHGIAQMAQTKTTAVSIFAKLSNSNNRK